MVNDFRDAPAKRSCGTMIEYNRLAELDPGYRARLADIEDNIQRRVAKMSGVARLSLQVIPVVVHILYKVDDDNISGAQVASQIDVLNQDFNRQNSDVINVPLPWSGLVGNAHIKFKIATIDPNGEMRSGIIRKRTEVDFFGQDDGMKFSASGGSDAWDTDQYLNIWVCNLADGLLGYAQFPGGPSDTDGVVVQTRAFGTVGTASAPFDRGRTTTHEVGHFLNLRHIWGDTEDCSGTDHVSDTPRQKHPNYGTPTFPTISCNNGPHGDMFMNYMDYVNDAAMFMFTAGQVARMRATLAGPRSNLVKEAAKRT